MLNKTERIDAIISLGNALDPEQPALREVMEQAQILNPWFTQQNVTFCLNNWMKALQPEAVNEWFEVIHELPSSPKKVGIIMAGNIPLVGLHDLLAVIACGHMALVKPSHSDETLIKYVLAALNRINPAWEERILLVDRLQEAEAVIATGSDNSSRYFEYYFSKIPHIIRKNRTGVAVLNGSESDADLAGLAEDIFTYFGLGCRNITKVYVPENYDFSVLINALKPYSDLINHHKFANNYTYHKAIFLMNLDKHLDTGYLLLKEDSGLHAPLSCLFYEYYDSAVDLEQRLATMSEQLQIIVSNQNLAQHKPFGTTQHTGLKDYADKVDVVSFLSNL